MQCNAMQCNAMPVHLNPNNRTTKSTKSKYELQSHTSITQHWVCRQLTHPIDRVLVWNILKQKFLVFTALPVVISSQKVCRINWSTFQVRRFHRQFLCLKYRLVRWSHTSHYTLTQSHPLCGEDRRKEMRNWFHPRAATCIICVPASLVQQPALPKFQVQRPMHQRAPVGHWRQHLCYKIGSALSQKPVSRAALHFQDETHRLLRLRCSVGQPHLLNGGCSVRRFPGQPVHRPLGSEGQGDSAGREGDQCWWSCTRRC